MLRRLFGYPFRLDLFCISVAMSLVLAKTCARLVTGSEWRQSIIMYVIPFFGVIRNMIYVFNILFCNFQFLNLKASCYVTYKSLTVNN